MFLHVSERVFVGVDQHKFVTVEIHRGAHEQIAGCVVFRVVGTVAGLVRLLYTSTLQELPSQDTCNKAVWTSV